mmetsp:Transcript_85978/g.242875  ORF Transcript_85978/g.242875 Transcript_85978/m.242875 type:complete len:96 (-) Transcript_85978:43-330(-)
MFRKLRALADRCGGNARNVEILLFLFDFVLSALVIPFGLYGLYTYATERWDDDALYFQWVDDGIDSTFWWYEKNRYDDMYVLHLIIVINVLYNML